MLEDPRSSLLPSCHKQRVRVPYGNKRQAARQKQPRGNKRTAAEGCKERLEVPKEALVAGAGAGNSRGWAVPPWAALPALRCPCLLPLWRAAGVLIRVLRKQAVVALPPTPGQWPSWVAGRDPEPSRSICRLPGWREMVMAARWSVRWGQPPELPRLHPESPPVVAKTISRAQLNVVFCRLRAGVGVPRLGPRAARF